MADGEAGPTEDLTTRRATVAFGALMVVAAVLVVIDALAIPDTSAVVGPAVVPVPVGVLLGVAGALLAGGALRGPGGARALVPAAWGAPPPAALRVVAMIAALLVFALVLPVLGWVVSAAALFVVAALLLGAPRGVAVVAYGWTLAATVFLVFDRVIGLSLPAGPWGF